MYGYNQTAGSGQGDLEELESQALAILQHMDRTHLQAIIDDDSKLEEIVKDLQKVKQVENEREMLMISNKSLAEYNLSVKPGLDELKTDVARHYELVSKLKLSIGEDKAKLDQHCGNQKMETMLALLQTRSAEAEEESEQLASAFLKQEMSVAPFLSSFLDYRKTAHIRKVKAEKLAELIRQGGVMGGGPVHPAHHNNSWPAFNSAPSGPAPIPPPHIGGPLPYPTGPGFPMPQPSFPYRP